MLSQAKAILAGSAGGRQKVQSPSSLLLWLCSNKRPIQAKLLARQPTDRLSRLKLGAHNSELHGCKILLQIAVAICVEPPQTVQGQAPDTSLLSILVQDLYESLPFMHVVRTH